MHDAADEIGTERERVLAFGLDAALRTHAIEGEPLAIRLRHALRPEHRFPQKRQRQAVLQRAKRRRERLADKRQRTRTEQGVLETRFGKRNRRDRHDAGDLVWMFHRVCDRDGAAIGMADENRAVQAHLLRRITDRCRLRPQRRLPARPRAQAVPWPVESNDVMARRKRAFKRDHRIVRRDQRAVDEDHVAAGAALVIVQAIAERGVDVVLV